MNIPGRRFLGGLPVLLLGLALNFPAQGIDSTAFSRLFEKPPREFSSAPLWVWNDLLTEDQIVGTLRDLALQNVKQVFVHPRPGLMTPYLSEDWFRLWKAALAEAERLDMNIWIYDENSYPSGFAGGHVPEAMPESRGRGLSFREVSIPPKWAPSDLAIFRLGGAQIENVTETARFGRNLPSGQHYLIASVGRAANSPWHGGRFYVDLMYPGVSEKFLDITLGAYERELGIYFGKRIPGIFTDEPNIHPAGGLPWTEDLPDQFRKRWSYDLLDNLPSLHFETGDWRRVRHNYYAVLNELFIDRWAKPYSERCAKLGLEMTGHYWEHDWPNCSSVPDNMAMYAWEQRPAIDCLMNQYAEHTHAQFGNIRSVRELGSVANQLGKRRTLCEVYGAGGWDLRFEDMKRQADWLGVLGVSTFDQHLSYVTLRGARKRDHPQSFSYHEPWWNAYGLCGSYLERLSVAVSQGDQVNKILVLEPTSSAWMYQGNDNALRELGDSFFKLLQSLDSAQIEYDLGCEDIIARHSSIQGAEFKVGQRSYHTVVLPPLTDNLNGRTWDLLNDYVAAGGKVISCTPIRSGYLPRRDGQLAPNEASFAGRNPRWEQVDVARLPQLLVAKLTTGDVRIARRGGDKGILFHMRRQLDDGDVLFLVNTSIESASAGILQAPARGLEQWDLESGQARPFSFERNSEGLQARFELPPCGSLLLFLSKRPGEPSSPALFNSVTETPSGPMEIVRLEPNVLTLDYVTISVGNETRADTYFYQASQFAFQKNGMERNPWDSAVQFKDELIKRQFPPESGFLAVYQFRIEEAVPKDLSIVIERPDLYRITCNDQPLVRDPGRWWLDKAFGRIDLKGAAHVGTNLITIQATPFTILHELEPAYLLGDFTLQAVDHGFVVKPDQPLQLGRWNQQGHPFYAAGVRYRQRFNCPEPLVGHYVVSMREWFGSVATVTVNGLPSGSIGYAPWECDVTDRLRPGENTIEVAVIGTLKNTLGPHHGKPTLGTAWPGMFQKAPNPGPPPGKDYDTVGYGLFNAFVLKQVSLQ